MTFRPIQQQAIERIERITTGGHVMTTINPSAVAKIQGRELIRAVAERLFGITVLGEANCGCYDGGWSVFGPVEDDESGHVVRLVYAKYPDDPWAGPDFAGMNYPRLFGYTPLALGVVPDYLDDPAEFLPMVEAVQAKGWRVASIMEQSGELFRGKFKWQVALEDKSGWTHYGFADTLPIAFARAALLAAAPQEAT